MNPDTPSCSWLRSSIAACCTYALRLVPRRRLPSLGPLIFGTAIFIARVPSSETWFDSTV